MNPVIPLSRDRLFISAKESEVLRQQLDQMSLIVTSLTGAAREDKDVLHAVKASSGIVRTAEACSSRLQNPIRLLDTSETAEYLKACNLLKEQHLQSSLASKPRIESLIASFNKHFQEFAEAFSNAITGLQQRFTQMLSKPQDLTPLERAAAQLNFEADLENLLIQAPGYKLKILRIGVKNPSNPILHIDFRLEKTNDVMLSTEQSNRNLELLREGIKNLIENNQGLLLTLVKLGREPLIFPMETM